MRRTVSRDALHPHMRTEEISTQSPIEVRPGPSVLACVLLSLPFVMIGALTFAGAAGVGDSGAEIGSAVFVIIPAAALVLSLSAWKQAKLFADQDTVGSVGVLGRVRLCPRADLLKIEIVWSRAIGWSPGVAVFPALRFRRTDGKVAFSQSAFFYRVRDLENFARYLNLPISLRRPPMAA
jgi:hypothetical protein